MLPGYLLVFVVQSCCLSLLFAATCLLIFGLCFTDLLLFCLDVVWCVLLLVCVFCELACFGALWIVFNLDVSV